MTNSNLYARFINLRKDNPNSKKKINTLLNEELYFSTVYGLNDFNELQYIAPSLVAIDGKLAGDMGYHSPNCEIHTFFKRNGLKSIIGWLQ